MLTCQHPFFTLIWGPGHLETWSKTHWLKHRRNVWCKIKQMKWCVSMCRQKQPHLEPSPRLSKCRWPVQDNKPCSQKITWLGGSSRFWPPPLAPRSCNSCLSAGGLTLNVRSNRQLIGRSTWRPFHKGGESLWAHLILWDGIRPRNIMKCCLCVLHPAKWECGRCFRPLPTGRGLAASTISIYLQYRCVFTLLPLVGWRVISPMQSDAEDSIEVDLPFFNLHLSVISNCLYLTNGANTEQKKVFFDSSSSQWSGISRGNKTVSDKSCIQTHESPGSATCSALCHPLSSTLPRCSAPSLPSPIRAWIFWSAYAGGWAYFSSCRGSFCVSQVFSRQRKKSKELTHVPGHLPIRHVL